MSGLGSLIRLIVRRDRIKLPLWIGGVVAMLLAMVPLLRNVYGDQASLESLYSAFGTNPAGLFMTGPMAGPTLGSLMTIETLLWWGIAIALINSLLIVRHTRHNEEIGAQELLLSGQVSRTASLTAALIAALGVNVLIVLGIGFGLQMMDVPWSGAESWLYALSMGGFGLVWAAIAAVVVQLVESGRSANGIIAGLLGVGFIVRGIGDFMGKTGANGIHQPEWISALSPFGWLQATRPLTNPEWTPLLISIGFALLAIAVAFVLQAYRDVGAGLLPSRSGKTRASGWLATSLGLTLYVQKNVFLGWLAGVLAMVGTLGALVPQMSEVFNSSESMRQVIGDVGEAGALIPSFMSAMIGITSLLVFGYVIHALAKLRSEEASGRLENLLATRLARLKWLALHVGMIVVGSAVMLAATGAILALCINLLSDVSVNLWEYTLAGLSYFPVALAFMALYMLLFGLLPRLASGVSWLYFGFVAFTLWLGPIMQLHQAIMNLSIMEHVSAPPVENIAWSPLVIIVSIAVALGVAGVVAFRRRDVID